MSIANLSGSNLDFNEVISVYEQRPAKSNSSGHEKFFFLRGRDGGGDFRMKGGAVGQRCSGGVWARLTSEIQYPTG